MNQEAINIVMGARDFLRQKQNESKASGFTAMYILFQSEADKLHKAVELLKRDDGSAS